MRGCSPRRQRAGRAKVYGQDHLDRLAQIRDLQGRRFSLAAIKALLESERPELVDGIFSGEGSISYSLEDLVERSGGSADLADRLRDAGLLRDPAEFGRDAYDATDLDVLRAVVELERLGLPDDVLVELASHLRRRASSACSSRCSTLFSGHRGPDLGPRGADRRSRSTPPLPRASSSPSSPASSSTCTSARCSASRSAPSSRRLGIPPDPGD